MRLYQQVRSHPSFTTRSAPAGCCPRRRSHRRLDVPRRRADGPLSPKKRLRLAWMMRAPVASAATGSTLTINPP